jgi:hypothetical protein
MKLLTCAAVRRRLTAFHDRELPVADMIAVESHLDGCPPCAREASSLVALGELLRAVSVTAAAEQGDLAGLRADVISRVHQEREDALPARLERLRDDLHLVWIGLAAAAATLVCGAMVAGLLHFASPGRSDSLAGLIQALATPGSNGNPVRLETYMRYPSPGIDVVPAALASSIGREEAILTLQAIVTREGAVRELELLSDNHDHDQIEQLLDAISRARFEPARQAGAPIAVNMVWLLAHTTVRGKQHL